MWGVSPLFAKEKATVSVEVPSRFAEKTAVVVVEEPRYLWEELEEENRGRCGKFLRFSRRRKPRWV